MKEQASVRLDPVVRSGVLRHAEHERRSFGSMVNILLEEALHQRVILPPLAAALTERGQVEKGDGSVSARSPAALASDTRSGDAVKPSSPRSVKVDPPAVGPWQQKVFKGPDPK